MSDSGAPEQPTYERIMTAVGDRFWQLAGPALADAGHRDLVFGTTWQDCMWAVEQGVMDAYGPERRISPDQVEERS